MAPPKDSTMAETPSDVDVIMNRVNLSLARSQKLINSWLPPKPAEGEDESQANALDTDEDFKPMSEHAGIGSKLAYDDEGLPDGAFQRKKLSSNDKLLEQLLGKKAAQAKKKSQEAQKSMATSKHAAPKPLISRPKRDVESDEEEEGGRAAAFKSRKLEKPRKQKTEEDTLGVEDEMDEETGITGSSSSDPADRPAKKKSGSYLDELLAQKANKKNRKKNKT